MSTTLELAKSKVRLELAPRREPYWERLEAGGHLGFRKLKPDGGDHTFGTWVAKWRDHESGERKSKPLGAVRNVTHDEAAKAATVWFEQCAGGMVKIGTVAEACTTYIAHRRKLIGDAAADADESMFGAHVYEHKISRKMLDKLRMPEIEEWLEGLAEGRAKNSCNRILRSFKAALDYARKKGMCPPNHRPWTDVGSFSGPGASDKSRAVGYLTLEQRRLLLSHCSVDVANYIKAILYTSARPQEARDALVGDFDSRQGLLRFSHFKGKTSKKRTRSFRLGTEALTFFTEMAKDKLPLAPLLTDVGTKWDRHRWARAIKAGIKLANAKLKKDNSDIKDDKLLPTDIVAYTFRHCAISDWLEAGEDISRVAKDAGTSINMITDYYDSHIRTTYESKRSNVQVI